MAKKYQVIGTPFDGSDLPEVSENDNGKVLRVVDGEWVADDQPVADGVSEASDEDIENLFKEEKSASK